MTRSTILVVPICLLLASTLYARKPDWPGTGGKGVNGFGLLELTPVMDGDKPKPTTFTINYNVPGKYAINATSGQIIALHCSAFREFNNIPSSAFLLYNIGETRKPERGLLVSAQLTIDKPGLYVIVYGPYNGLLTFDDAEARETYKISATAPDGATLRWVDQDAGDVTIADLHNRETNSKDRIIRLRMVRAGLRPLTNKANFKIEPFQLHEMAADRAALLQANW